MTISWIIYDALQAPIPLPLPITGIGWAFPLVEPSYDKVIQYQALSVPPEPITNTIAPPSVPTGWNTGLSEPVFNKVVLYQAEFLPPLLSNTLPPPAPPWGWNIGLAEPCFDKVVMYQALSDAPSKAPPIIVYTSPDQLPKMAVRLANFLPRLRS